MSLNFHYAAHTYVDNWVVCDRKARNVLGFRRGYQPEPEQAREQLIEVAKIYGIARNFRLGLEGDNARLSPVWDALKEINEPASEEDAKDCVKKLVETLKPTYGHELTSAASKFLWMRFGGPIVIIDSMAKEWICREWNMQLVDAYNDFYNKWRESFNARKSNIDAACKELLRANAMKFLCPNDVTTKEFEQAVSSREFAERVFDHAIVNDESQRRNLPKV
jgi:hypothetical protein